MESIYLVAFIIGLVSFLSPCIIPMITVYFSLITGLSLDELQSLDNQKGLKKRVIINTLIFIAAFTLVFTLIGGVVNGLGHILQQKLRFLNIIGGVFVIILALKMLGTIKLRVLNKLDLRSKFDPAKISTKYSYLTTFLVGIFFAIVCSHCIGATLYSMIMLTGASGVNGFLVMFLFSIGLGIPYFIVALSFNKAIPIIKRLSKHHKKIQFIIGIILMIFGILMVFNKFSILTKLLKQIIPFKLPYGM